MQANRILMLLSNAYDPDPRVRQEAVSLLAMGCEIRILAWDRDLKAAAHESMEGIDVERVFVRSTHGRGLTQVFWYGLVYLKLLWRGLRTRFDVVHCHDLDTLPIGVLLGLVKRRPVVYDAHESFADMLADSVPRFAQRALASLEGLLMRRCALVITVGEKLRRYLELRGARHSVVVGNWKRLGDFVRTPSQNHELRSRFGIPEAALLVVCVTQLRPDRKLEELLDAAAVSPDVFVLIAGTGALAARVTEAAAVNPRIVYTGFASGRTIADYTCAADVIYYGFDPDNPNARFSAPNKLFEALAAGRPLLTGDFGEIADVVRAAGCGIVLSEYSIDEIRRALLTLADPNVRAAMAGNAARAGRTSFNWETGEEVLYREYSALLPGLRKPGPEMRAALASATAGRS
jgi:glycosyltransferase involved in cell wall biosynthesis